MNVCANAEFWNLFNFIISLTGDVCSIWFVSLCFVIRSYYIASTIRLCSTPSIVNFSFNYWIFSRNAVKTNVCNFTSVKTWSGTFYHNINGALTIMDLEWCCNYCNIYYPWTQNLKTKRKPIRLPVVFHIYIHDTYCMPLVIFHFDQNINSWTLVLGEPLPAVYLKYCHWSYWYSPLLL